MNHDEFIRFKNINTLTVSEIAYILDVHKDTVRTWIRNKKLRPCKSEYYKVHKEKGYLIELRDFVMFVKNNPKYIKKFPHYMYFIENNEKIDFTHTEYIKLKSKIDGHIITTNSEDLLQYAVLHKRVEYYTHLGMDRIPNNLITQTHECYLKIVGA